MHPYVSFNTSSSFVSNTNWHAYGGEFTLSYTTQMLGLTVQNFVTPAVGLAVLLALIRGLTRKDTDWVVNFWVDMTRSVVYVLLPLSIVWATVLVWQGVPQNLSDYTPVNGIQGFTQLLAQGPAASQVAIKQLGTNGGGFFNINSAHPFENPTPLANFAEVLAILLIPAACVYMFGKMVSDKCARWFRTVPLTKACACMRPLPIPSGAAPAAPMEVSAELLGQSDDDALRPADVAEPIRVLVLNHFAYQLSPVGAQARDDSVDVFDGEHDATDAQRVHRRVHGPKPDRVGRVELVELDATVAVRGPHQREGGANVLEPDQAVDRRSLDRRLAFQLHTEFGEERFGSLEVVDNDENVVHPLNRHIPGA